MLCFSPSVFFPHSPLPHGLRTESGDVCLFTRDEPKMTSEQAVKFYNKLLKERGVKNAIEVLVWPSVFNLYALQQPLSFCFSAGHGLKSARVIRSVSRRVSFSIGARLYKLWNNHDSQAGWFYVTVCIMKYGVILIVYTHFVLLGDSVQHVENWV